MWESIKNYYLALGERYQVDPVLFVGIHVVATPLFAAAVWWILYNRKKGKSILLPSLVAAFIFNAANIYLVLWGRNIPWWIYAIVGLTTLLSTFATVKKIRKRLKEAGG
ncbi:MAG TPA: hypothetical protein VHK69_03450 [Chitinophagaceae bacterium]|jgi:hypothetical protein|nr:hypothetical protein [Chitinophagaceae bacterium]